MRNLGAAVSALPTDIEAGLCFVPGFLAVHVRLAAVGFCSIRNSASACRRRVVVLMMRFPPIGGGEAPT